MRRAERGMARDPLMHPHFDFNLPNDIIRFVSLAVNNSRVLSPIEKKMLSVLLKRTDCSSLLGFLPQRILTFQQSDFCEKKANKTNPKNYLRRLIC